MYREKDTHVLLVAEALVEGSKNYLITFLIDNYEIVM